MNENQILLKCIKENNKLRIRIISNGYFNNANCQFPRALREEGKLYSVPTTSIHLAQSCSVKYFYRISMPISSYVNELPIIIYNSKDEPNCIICLDKEKEKICVPCGHYNMCSNCINKLPVPKKCPLCRMPIRTMISSLDL